MTIKGQVEVPRQIRDRLGLKSGDKMAFTHVAERRHRRHATQDPASGRAGRLAHPAWAPSGFDRGHEPVQGAGRNESGEAIVTMSIALDTNVSMRLLVRDDEVQYAAARRLVDRAAAADEPVLIVLRALLEIEWVAERPSARQSQHRGRDLRAAGKQRGRVRAPPTVQESLYVEAQHPEADFADCLLAARAAHLGRSPFLTFDAGAARLPGVELLARRPRVNDGALSPLPGPAAAATSPCPNPTWAARRRTARAWAPCRPPCCRGPRR